MLATRTFLFSDLRDYTQFVQRHGDAAATQLIGDYRRIVRAEIASHEGAEIKTEGDSFYVVFPGARAAVSAASALLREAERYSEQRPDRPLRIGVGIHAGEPQPHEGQYVGSAVIVAARLAQSAGAGDLLISDVVRSLLPRDGMPQLEERTGITLKGLDDPPRVYAVRWAREPAARPREEPGVVSIAAAEPSSRQVLCPVVVGREAELTALEGYLADARRGQGRTVLIGGEAGLGKSALVRRFADVARASGARLLVGECSEIEARRPFGPVIDALAAAGVALPSELTQGGPGAQPIAEAERYRVHAGFADRLAGASAEGPVVLVIEDLHWGDEATYELVPYLARKLRERAVMLLATYRTDELHRTHPLNHVLAELARGRLVQEIILRPLTEDELADLVRLALGLTRPTTAEFRRALHERTEGNPFFVEEILRALVEKGELAYRDGSWHRTKEVADLTIPVSVRDAVQQRLAAMPATARRAMQVAAVIGQRFEFELLREVSGQDETALFEAIRSGIDEQLVVEEADPEREAYRFRHALSREAVLGELLHRERRLLHRAVGEAIERQDRERVEALAYHFDEARDARAFGYHERAARESLRVLAFSAALRHLERAIEIAPDDEPRLGELHARLSDLALQANDFGRADRAAAVARELAVAAGDVRGEGAALSRLARIQWYFGATEEAARLARESVKRLEPLGPSPELAGAYCEVSRLAMIAARNEEAIEVGERALAMAKQVQAPQIEAAALINLGTARTHGDDDAGLAQVRSGIALAVTHDLIGEAQRGHQNLVASLFRLGAAPAELVAAHEDGMAHSHRYGVRMEAAIARESGFATVLGDWDRALATSDELGTATAWGASRHLSETIMRVARDGPAALGDPEPLRARLVTTGEPQWLASVAAPAVALSIAGRLQEVLVIAEPVKRVRAGGTNNFWAHAVTVSAIEAALRLGDSRLEGWLAYAEGTDVPPDNRYGRLLRAEAAAARVLGRGDADGARRAYVEVAEAADAAFGQFWPTTLARLRVAELAAAAGDRDVAQAAFDAILPFWRKAKAGWYLARLGEWAREHGLRA